MTLMTGLRVASYGVCFNSPTIGKTYVPPCVGALSEKIKKDTTEKLLAPITTFALLMGSRGNRRDP